jgi:hypothetical protein
MTPEITNSQEEIFGPVLPVSAALHRYSVRSDSGSRQMGTLELRAPAAPC